MSSRTDLITSFWITQLKALELFSLTSLEANIVEIHQRDAA